MTNNIEFDDDGRASRFTIVDMFGDNIRFTNYGSERNLATVRVDDGSVVAVGYEDRAALCAFINQECDDFPPDEDVTDNSKFDLRDRINRPLRRIFGHHGPGHALANEFLDALDVLLDQEQEQLDHWLAAHEAERVESVLLRILRHLPSPPKTGDL